MISPQLSHPRSIVALSLALALAACENATTVPTHPQLRPGAASFDGNEAKTGSIAARVLVNKAGTARLEVRTGTFDNATNLGTTNGWFESVDYTVYTPTGKKLLHRSVNFKKSTPTLFSEIINLCDTESADEDDYSAKTRPPCVTPFDNSFVVAVDAHTRGVAGDANKSDIVRLNAPIFSTPDVDLSLAVLRMIIPGTPPTIAELGLVQKGVAQTFQAQFVNTAPGGNAAVGVIATCEVHVYQGTTMTEVSPPGGITYRWVPNGRPGYNATLPGSVVSDTVSISPGNLALCQFTLTLPELGSYRLVVKANTVYPSDYDTSNNSTFGFVTAVSGNPVQPPAGGFGKNAAADDFGYYGGIDRSTTPARFTPFLGDSGQVAGIDDLSAIVLDGTGLTGSFTLKVDLSTVDSVANQARTGVRDLAKVSWTGDLGAAYAIAAADVVHPIKCVSSDQLNGVTTVYAKNGNRMLMSLCFEAQGSNWKIGVNLRWIPTTNPPPPVSAANGAAQFGDFIYFDTDLSFTEFEENPVSHAPVQLKTDGGRLTTGTNPTLGAKIVVHRFAP